MITEDQAHTYAMEIRSEVLKDAEASIPLLTVPGALIWMDENEDRVVVHDLDVRNLMSLVKTSSAVGNMAEVMYKDGALSSLHLSALMHFVPLTTELSVGKSFSKKGDSVETLMYVDYTDQTFSWYIVNGKTQSGEFLGKMHNVPWERALSYMPEGTAGHEFLLAASKYLDE